MTKTIGQVAYEAYFTATEGKSLVSGKSLPNWADQRQDIKQAWEAAAVAVFEDVIYEIRRHCTEILGE